jgi:hypothetical protein
MFVFRPPQSAMVLIASIPKEQKKGKSTKQKCHNQPTESEYLAQSHRAQNEKQHHADQWE